MPQKEDRKLSKKIFLKKEDYDNLYSGIQIKITWEKTIVISIPSGISQ